MARRAVGAREHHRPRDIGYPAGQLGVDEVAEPAGGDPGGMSGARKSIRHVVNAMAAGGDRHGSHHAQQPAMEGHAALPDGEDLERMRSVIARLVKQHVAEAAAEDDSEHHEKQQVVELRA